MRGAAFVAILCTVICSCTRAPVPATDITSGRNGERLWVEVPGGRLRAQAYRSQGLSEHPTLIVVLHGDLFDPAPSYQYAFAQAVAQGADAPVLPEAVRTRLEGIAPQKDVIAVGILRPGYVDGSGDRSDGDRGTATLDNYTPEAVDAISSAIGRLKAQYSAARVILVGRSGGAAISADILGRHPEIADGALLVACGCDPDGIRTDMSKTRPLPAWKGPTRSLKPLELVHSIRTDVKVRMVVGEADDTAPVKYSRAYVAALQNRGVTVHLTIAPALGHNILLRSVVFEELAALLQEVR
ncbi:MAG TPA: prolyl oligopeptidase family serine peptidase [Steroidobacteraceae bacterium]|jgi:predicted esterase